MRNLKQPRIEKKNEMKKSPRDQIRIETKKKSNKFVRFVNYLGVMKHFFGITEI